MRPYHGPHALLARLVRGLVVVPRYVRKVCANGTVVATGGGIGRMVEAYEVGEASRACL